MCQEEDVGGLQGTGSRRRTSTLLRRISPTGVARCWLRRRTGRNKAEGHDEDVDGDGDGRSSDGEQEAWEGDAGRQ